MLFSNRKVPLVSVIPFENSRPDVGLMTSSYKDDKGAMLELKHGLGWLRLNPASGVPMIWLYCLGFATFTEVPGQVVVRQEV